MDNKAKAIVVELDKMQELQLRVKDKNRKLFDKLAECKREYETAFDLFNRQKRLLNDNSMAGDLKGTVELAQNVQAPKAAYEAAHEAVNQYVRDNNAIADFRRRMIAEVEQLCKIIQPQSLDLRMSPNNYPKAVKYMVYALCVKGVKTTDVDGTTTVHSPLPKDIVAKLLLDGGLLYK